MDKEEAKFLLASFRACGSDADDPAFKEALELALKDQELAEWLVKERAFDSQFTECVGALKVPDELRSQLSELFEPRLDENSEEELQVIGALATIEPPSELRGEILNAMQVVSNNSVVKADFTKKKKISYWFPLAMAAMVAFGLFLGFSSKSGSGDQLASMQAMAEESKRLLTSQQFSLDHIESDYLKLVSWASDNETPVPGELPTSLSGMETIGCKQFNVNGKPAAIICFNTDEFGTLHLIVMDAKNLEECNSSLPCINTVKEFCVKCPESGCSTAQWQHDGKAYMLISKTQPVEEFQEIF